MSMKNCTRKWRQKLRAFLFESTFAYRKKCVNGSILTLSAHSFHMHTHKEMSSCIAIFALDVGERTNAEYTTTVVVVW